MELFFKFHAYALLVFTVWMVYVFWNEWKDTYSKKSS